MTKKFNTYAHKQHEITPDQNVYLMYTQVNNGDWRFKGIVSEKAKAIIQSDDTIKRMNENYDNQVVYSTFTKKKYRRNKEDVFVYSMPSCGRFHFLSYIR